ncbi:MAG TPA: methyltransferase domain-containing protein [Rubricoccaceae bacterium]|nr:methyltransferase domain-containing protein [Rubricoccaceae bacterium]
MIAPRTPFDAVAVARHYDGLDAFYREVWGEHVHHGLFVRGDEAPGEAAEALTRKVAAAARLPPGARVCDVGCGYGATARWLAEHAGAHVTGLTLSEAQAAYAGRQAVPAGVPAPEILVRDWLRNDLPDTHFDAVIAVESTTHMPERARVFAEMARVLKPGRRLVACVWMAGEGRKGWEGRHLLEPICREGRLAGMGSAAENRAWIEGAGLVVEAEEDLSRAVARTWTVCLRRVAGRLLRDPRYCRFLLDATQDDRAFALTLLRIRLAYATGAMRYGFFVARKG